MFERIFLSRTWFELIAPPLRPRLHSLYMLPRLIADDDKFARIRDIQFNIWRAMRRRKKTLKMSIRQHTSRSQLPPITFASQFVSSHRAPSH